MTTGRWRRRLRDACLGAVVLGAVAVVDAAPARPAAPAQAVQAPCPEAAAVVVSARDDADRRDACAGAADALRFFDEALGLGPTETLYLDVVDALPPDVSPRAAGCWLRERKRILVLSHAKFRRARDWFGVPVDRRLHRSVVAHETAHALAACHFAAPAPPVQAQEYVAYVTLFATMDPAQRARALKTYPDPAFDDEARINTMVYLFDPMRFGARAWRHYAQPENGPAFLKRVLAGQAITE